MGRVRVLVVEDDPQFGRVLKKMLDRAGYRVALARDADGALLRIEDDPPAVVLVDLWLPGGDGLSLVREIRRRDEQVRIVGMSGRAIVMDVVQLYRAGICDFLTKPFCSEELAAAMGRAEVAGSAASAPGPEATDEASTTGPEPTGEASTPTQTITSRVEDAVRALRSGTLDLPMLAPISGDIQRMFASPHCGVSEVVAVVERDPALVATVLASANTVSAGTRRSIDTLPVACVRLGNRRILALAQEALIRRAIGPAAGRFAAYQLAAWRNMVVTANLARALSVSLRRSDGESLYIAGLLHNVGELAILHALSEQSVGEPPAGDSCADLAGLVHRHHEEVGALLLRSWGMAPQVGEPSLTVVGQLLHPIPPRPLPALTRTHAPSERTRGDLGETSPRGSEVTVRVQILG